MSEDKWKNYSCEGQLDIFEVFKIVKINNEAERRTLVEKYCMCCDIGMHKCGREVFSCAKTQHFHAGDEG